MKFALLRCFADEFSFDVLRVKKSDLNILQSYKNRPPSHEQAITITIIAQKIIIDTHVNSANK